MPVVRDLSQVECRNLVKRFDAIEALVDIDLTIEQGKIHALVGENGAGKSTLGKIISGVLRPDQGELVVKSRPVHYASPYDALADGITIISQELSLVPRMNVMENVFLGMESHRSGVLQQNHMRRRYAELIERSGFSLPAGIPVGRLRTADQKKVEILRAIARNAELVVMDEPTAALTSDETGKLLNIIRWLREAGKTVVYVSHNLEEVLGLADTVTVLRNGHLVRTSRAEEETPESLVTAMIGRAMNLAFPPKAPLEAGAAEVLSVRGLTRPGIIEDVSIYLRRGEIVGLAGLVGSGRSEVARAIFGADGNVQGEIRLGGRSVRIGAPNDAIRAGIALLPESRKLQGLVMTLQIGKNVTLPHLGTLSTASLIRGGQEARETSSLLKALDVRPAQPAEKITRLSGGNQQKVLFAKWLFRSPQVLIADEPTSGVDVGAKQAIYKLIRSLAEQGMGVLLISSEIEEVLGLAHRVYAMRQGRVVAELEGAAISEEAVMRAVFATPEGAGNRLPLL